jgi:ABC-type multidrug transport system ATPase subunit
MFSIEARHISKRFGSKKIFSDLTFCFNKAKKIAVLGSNGSGKSTFLKILMSYMQPDSGKVVYNFEGKEIQPDQVWRYVSFCAPYQQLPEELNTHQLYHFASSCKPFLLKNESFFELACSSLQDVDKPIKSFSSGMKQRLKLSLAFSVKSRVLFLDEPTSNLDKTNESWYYTNFERFATDKLVILASNQELEYKNFDSTLDMDEICSLILN